MAELVTIYRVDIEEAKALIAKEYGIKPEDIKFWNGKFEFQKPGEQKVSGRPDVLSKSNPFSGFQWMK